MEVLGVLRKCKDPFTLTTKLNFSKDFQKIVYI